jgi:hypothetical protein
VISFGFWAGDDTVGDAAYYSCTAPEPAGLRSQALPAGAWTGSGAGSLAVLPYETVRTARDPRTTLLAFCQSAYEAGARLAGWETASFGPLGAQPRTSFSSSRRAPPLTSAAGKALLNLLDIALSAH